MVPIQKREHDEKSSEKFCMVPIDFSFLENFGFLS